MLNKLTLPIKVGEEKKRSSHNLDVEAAIFLLAERYPKTFFIYEKKRKPLRIGIITDLIADLNGLLPEEEIRHAIRCYVNNNGYWRSCCKAGKPRFSLDGSESGVVSEDEAKYSYKRL